MRKYDAVTNTLEVISNPNNYVRTDYYRNSGDQKVLSTIFIPNKTLDTGLEDFMCLNTCEADIIGTFSPALTTLVNPKYICLFAHSFKADDFTSCNIDSSYWLYLSLDSLKMLLNFNEPLKIDTIYIKCMSLGTTEQLAHIIHELSELNSLIRKYSIKNVLIEFSPTAQLKYLLYNIQQSLPVIPTFVINYVGTPIDLQTFYKESSKYTSRFILGSNSLLDNCNQYFYQDDSFVRFSRVSQTNNDIAYNIIYYYKRIKNTTEITYLDKMNMMVYHNNFLKR